MKPLVVPLLIYTVHLIIMNGGMYIRAQDSYGVHIVAGATQLLFELY